MNKFRRYFRGLSAGLLALCMSLTLCAPDSRAAEKYTYTVTFYAGNYALFNGVSQVSVDNSATGSAYKVNGDADCIRVSGLQAGDVVSFDAAVQGAMKMDANTKYYIKGIRLSGRDNTVDSSAFRVDADRDYVVAYGVKGDQVSYAVNYQDAFGNTLAPSRTYYGNVGDKPVIAFLYLEGYQPQAYNLAKTLSVNEAENVFTFVYTRVTRPSSGTPSGNGQGTAGGTGTSSAVTVVVPGAGAEGNPNEGTGAQGTNQPGGGEQLPGGNEQGTENPQEPGGQLPGGNEQGTENPEGAGGQEGPQEVIDLDEENLPLAGNEQEAGTSTGLRVAAIAGILVSAAAAVLILALWYHGRHRKKKEQE